MNLEDYWDCNMANIKIKSKEQLSEDFNILWDTDEGSYYVQNKLYSLPETIVGKVFNDAREDFINSTACSYYETKSTIQYMVNYITSESICIEEWMIDFDHKKKLMTLEDIIDGI